MFLLAALLNLSSIFHCHSNQLDSLPSLHTLNDEDIVSVSGSRETDTLTVVLKNDSVLLYPFTAWDFEDSYASTPQRISNAIKSMQRTFTRLEVPPAFPGGLDSLAVYVKNFCRDHAKELKDCGYGDIMISFIVHLKGQRMNYSHIGIGEYSEARFNFAVKCIKEGPDWITGVQNGRKVIAYASVVVHLYPDRKIPDSAVYFNAEIHGCYPGGIQSWKRYLQKNLRYPPKAVDDNIQGTVNVQFIVDSTGLVHDVSAVSGPDELRAEAVRVIKNSGTWVSGVQNGWRVNTWVQMPVDFDLNGPWHF